MHALSAWFTKNPVAANLLMLLVLLGGFFTLQTMRIEGFPALPPQSVTVTTIYPGADADQVDRGIARKIEKALEGMPGIKRISSLSEEGFSTVTIQKVSGFDIDRFQNEINSRVDSIFSFPQSAERPIITRDELNIEALLVQIYGDTDTATLQKIARQVREDLLADPKIEKIEDFGLLPYEVRIEVDKDKLRAHGVALQDIGQAVQRASLDYKRGDITSEAGRVVIRADHKAMARSEFEMIPVQTRSDGTRILIRDVARVVDGFEEDFLTARFQGKPSVGIQIFTGKSGHLIEISKATRELVDRLRTNLPEGVQVDIWGDYSEYMKARLTLLSTNAWQGLLIVFALLALFLNVRLAFWVAMGIPISLAGAIALMGDRFLGHSLNDLTTFGMIIVLGILVDDAVVVGESVFESRSKNADPIEGTIKGVHRVSTATIFGCFTTIAAFLPLLLINSDIGKAFASFAIVVIVALLVSLVESKMILPAHLAAVRLDGPPSSRFLPRLWRSIQNTAQQAIDFANTRLYQPALRIALRHRYTTLVLLLAASSCGFSLMINGWVRMVFFPDVPGQIITVNMDMKSGSPRGLTDANIASIERAAREVNAEAMEELGTDEPPIAKVLSAKTGEFSVMVLAELQSEKTRKLETLETLKRWREKTGVLEGAEQLSFSGTFETGGGFVIELGARDQAVLAEATKRFTSELGQLAGMHDIRDDSNRGTPEVRLRLKPEAEHLGLGAADLASQIGDAFGGLEVQRFQRAADEVKVYVKLGEDRRRYLRDLLETRIRTTTGEWIPLPLVADIVMGATPSELNRQNGRRVTQVRATLDKEIISASEAMQWIRENIEPGLVAHYPDLTITGAGEIEEMATMSEGLKRAVLLILVVIYTLMAVPLRSYWQPLVIISVLPFGFVGAAVGHWITDRPFSVLSLFGMLAVMGIVVNDSLVLITRYNEIRKKGGSLESVLVTAGGSRFRAIFLTTVTTVCGLLPLLTETSEQAQYLIPVALSVAAGELFATPVTLFIVPTLLRVADDFAAVGRWIRGK